MGTLAGLCVLSWSSKPRQAEVHQQLEMEACALTLVGGRKMRVLLALRAAELSLRTAVAVAFQVLAAPGEVCHELPLSP